MCSDYIAENKWRKRIIAKSRNDMNYSKNIYKKAFYDESVLFMKSLLIFENLNIGYLQMPKAGCSTIKSLLINMGTLKSDPIVKGQDEIHDDPSFSSTFSNLKNYYFLSSKSVPIFTVVRNPFSRILSAYLEKIFYRYDERKDYLGELEFPSNEKIPFLTFLERVGSKPKNALDFHFMPQSTILNIKKHPNIIVGHLEDFDKISSEISRYILKVRRPEKAGEPNYVYEEVQNKKIAPHSVGASSAQKIKKYYGPREIDLVKSIYTEDFQSFGYSFSIDDYAKKGAISTKFKIDENQNARLEDIMTWRLGCEVMRKRSTDSIFGSLIK